MGREKIDMVPYARDAAELMGHQVRAARLGKRLTIEQLAGYARVSKGTISAIESGKPSVAFGNVLNTCAALGIQLFLPTPEELARMTKAQREVLRLMPNRVMPARVPDNDF
ncbi:MAG TPA: helix-turn-helix domain-containing protein [Arachnia sp.]|nr:helix-turn-helix domain-containing protein [Arachnia sp.]HMT85123.1 helix-turn-helix domain-containing protein [Arachnia sp.]